MNLLSLPGRIALVTILLGAGPAAGATRVTGTPQPVDGQALWAEAEADGTVRVLRGGETLAAVAPAFAIGDGSAQGELVRDARIAATAGGFALSELTAAVLDQGKGGTVTTRATRTVRRGTTVLASCEDAQADRPAQLAADGDTIAYQDPCARGTIVVDDGTTSERIDAGMPLGFDNLRIAGRYLAWAPFGEGAPAVLYDRIEDRVVLTALGRFGDQVSALGLQADGTLLVARSGRRLTLWSPRDRDGRALPARRGDRLIRGASLSGGRVAYVAHPRRDDELRSDTADELVVGDLEGHWETAARFGDAAQIGGGLEPFGFDGTAFAWATYRCGGAHTVDTAAPDLRPGCGTPTVPLQRVRVRDGHVAIRVTCPGACRSRLHVSGAGWVREVRLHGSGTVRVPLPPPTRRRLAGGKPAGLSVWIPGSYHGSVRITP